MRGGVRRPIPPVSSLLAGPVPLVLGCNRALNTPRTTSRSRRSRAQIYGPSAYDRGQAKATVLGDVGSHLVADDRVDLGPDVNGVAEQLPISPSKANRSRPRWGRSYPPGQRSSRRRSGSTSAAAWSQPNWASQQRNCRTAWTSVGTGRSSRGGREPVSYSPLHPPPTRHSLLYSS